MIAEVAHAIPEARQLDLGARRIPYVQYTPTGEPNGETIELHHGIGMPPTHWGEFPQDLADLGYEVVAFGTAEEHRSALSRILGSYKVMGKAALRASVMPPLTPLLWLDAVSQVLDEQRPPLTATLDRYAKDAAVASRAIIGKPSHKVGVSWGGALVQQLGADYPGETKSVIAAATLPAVPLPLLDLPDRKAVAAIVKPHRSHTAAGDLYGGDFRDPELLEKYKHMIQIIERKIQLLPHMEQQQALMFGFTLAWRNVGKVAIGDSSVPTTFLYGDDDPIIPPRMVTLGARILGADAQCVKGGGHGFFMSRPKTSAGLVHEIISQHNHARAA